MTELIFTQVLYYAFMLLILVSASFCVISKNIVNAILWFNMTAISVFALLVFKGLHTVAFISAIACISLSATLLLFNSCYIAIKQSDKPNSDSKFFLSLCIGISIIAIVFSVIKPSNVIVEVKQKYYDNTMYIATILFSVIFLITIFGLKVFDGKRD